MQLNHKISKKKLAERALQKKSGVNARSRREQLVKGRYKLTRWRNLSRSCREGNTSCDPLNSSTKRHPRVDLASRDRVSSRHCDGVHMMFFISICPQLILTPVNTVAAPTWTYLSVAAVWTLKKSFKKTIQVLGVIYILFLLTLIIYCQAVR